MWSNLSPTPDRWWGLTQFLHLWSKFIDHLCTLHIWVTTDTLWSLCDKALVGPSRTTTSWTKPRNIDEARRSRSFCGLSLWGPSQSRVGIKPFPTVYGTKYRYRLHGCEKFHPDLASLFCLALPWPCLARFAHFLVGLSLCTVFEENLGAKLLPCPVPKCSAIAQVGWERKILGMGGAAT